MFYSWSDTSLSEIHIYYSIGQTGRDSLLIPLKKNLQKRKLDLIRCSSSKLIVNLPMPTLSLNKAAVHIVDSVGTNMDFDFELIRDRIIFTSSFELGKKYTLLFESGSLVYFTKEESKQDLKLEFKAQEEKAKSSIIIKMNAVQNEGIRLDLLAKDKKIRTYDLSGLQSLSMDSLNENTYSFKIYTDSNRNGRWDTGNFEEKREAEFLWFYSAPIELKSDWDKELNISF
ncbi:MAG: hypothetical protein R2772_08520 [Chitinophagales bacterium]